MVPGSFAVVAVVFNRSDLSKYIGETESFLDEATDGSLLGGSTVSLGNRKSKKFNKAYLGFTVFPSRLQRV